MSRKIFAILAIATTAIAITAKACHNNEDAGRSPLSQTTTPAETQNYGDLLKVTLPANTPSQIKQYNGFTLSFNKNNSTPNYVAWELLASETDGTNSRTNKFWKDHEIDGCPAPSDYKNSGYDRGHMIPAADQKYSQDAMNDSFSMANITPQDHALNSKAWASLEKKCRLWAQRDSALIIIAGPIYTPQDNIRIGYQGIKVPSAFFKVIIAPYLQNPRGIAFIYPNMRAPGNMQNYSTTIREVEKITGFDFFPTLPDQIENQIETTSSFKEWNQ